MTGWWSKLLGRGDAGDGAPIRAMRWVVLDCESGGLDPERDPLLSIGAVGVRGGRIDHADTFDGVLRQEEATAAGNILVHGIGADAQLAGRAPGQVLGDFIRYAAGDAAVAFHAAFDRALLRRAMLAQGMQWHPRWLDLAQLAPALFPRHAASCKALDDWLEAFAIPQPSRHDALADAYATAQLLLVALAEAERQGAARVRELFAAERSGRWLG